MTVADNGMDDLETMAKMAYYEASAAAVLIPNAWSMVALIYEAQSNPGQIWDAADDWYEVKERLVAADKEVEAQLRSLTEDDWSGQDRDAFEEKLYDYQNQIRVSYVFAVAVHVLLKIVALLISMFIMMMWAFATILAMFAIAIIACAVAAWTGVGAAALAEVRIQATVVAGQLYMILKSTAAALETTFTGGAATLAGMMAVDVAAQMATGNTSAPMDFAQATVNSADDVIKGRLALLEQRITAQTMGGKGIGGFGIGKWKLPTRNIPKDIRPYISPQLGIKGIADVSQGSPTFTSPWTQGTEYGDDYVDQTDPLKAQEQHEGGG
jgi:hypothetical protein